MTKSKNQKAAAKAVEEKKETPREFFKELLEVVVGAFIVAFVFRTIFYDPFNIPSESMLPTLMTGDYIFVSKMSYGYSKYSTPFISVDLFDGRIFAGAVERGDVAVFKLPRDGETDYIKRVIGLPGDRIQMEGGVLYLNGEMVRKERVDDFVFEVSANMDCFDRPQYLVRRPDGVRECHYPRFRETLPNGVSYMTLDLDRFGPRDDTREYLVPEGYYFMMGDNRDNSQDSRVSSVTGVGFVPAENLVGRATMIIWSTNGDARWWQVWKWPRATRGERLFEGLQAE